MREETKEKLRRWNIEHNVKPPSREGSVPWNKDKKTGLIPKTAFKKGNVISEEMKQKISKTMKARGISPKIKWKKGMEPLVILRGDKHPNWKGGKSFEPYPTEWTDELKEVIRRREEYACWICGIHQDELGYKLHCHHINYDKNDLSPENLIALCRECHLKTNYNRDYWINYFKK